MLTLDIGKRITSLREQRGFTQNQLAKMAGIGQGRLSQIESGINKTPTVCYAT